MEEELLRDTAAIVMAHGVIIEHLLALHLSRYSQKDAEKAAVGLGRLLDTPGPTSGMSNDQAEALADVTVRAQVHLRAVTLRALLAGVRH
ncbi:hypothetical protein MMSR116_18025 [Methylobacterium mesophilicum SR1.6/6]|uniref:Uncharacterized protein n=1 Tax=Methylobacterium mesophilicum SR1.6/6 TaxID=908290 RepID=A0A6B9FLY5_9HYPH|nr:hypothetical protein [Methylobacterium mesophilicum]QGY03573.1 hypothetical protein MMSR116_18025 [Methylobacterium mesophilicum SR1.6/6]